MIDLNPRREISPEAFALLGAPDIAYVKPVVTDHGTGFGIFQPRRPKDAANSVVVP